MELRSAYIVGFISINPPCGLFDLELVYQFIAPDNVFISNEI